jgi:hypothetical protein
MRRIPDPKQCETEGIGTSKFGRETQTERNREKIVNHNNTLPPLYNAV